jgi:hypothetical protein
MLLNPYVTEFNGHAFARFCLTPKYVIRRGVNKDAMGVSASVGSQDERAPKRACLRQPTLPRCQGAACTTGAHAGPCSEFTPQLVGCLRFIMENCPGMTKVILNWDCSHCYDWNSKSLHCLQTRTNLKHLSIRRVLCNDKTIRMFQENCPLLESVFSQATYVWLKFSII